MKFGFLVASLASVLVTQTILGQSADSYFRAGLNAYTREGNRAAARTGFGKAIEVNPKHGPAHFNLGMLAEEEEQWNEAIKYYTAYTQIDTGGVYADIAQRKISALRKFADLDSTSDGRAERIFLQLLYRAQTKLAGGDLGAALALSEMAKHQRPNRFEAHLVRGTILVEAERFTEAVAALRTAETLAQPDKRAEITTIIERCTQLSSVHERIRAADAALASKEFVSAAEGYAQAWTLVDDPEFGIQAARAWTLAGDRTKAMRIYDLLLRSSDPSVVALARTERETLSLIASDGADAVKEPEKHPDFIRAQQLAKEGKNYESDAILTQLLDGLMPNKRYAPLYEERGASRLALREFAGAASDLSIAILIAPARGTSYEHRAAAYAGLGRFDEAARDIAQAIERSSKENHERLREQRDKYSTRAKIQ